MVCIAAIPLTPLLQYDTELLELSLKPVTHIRAKQVEIVRTKTQHALDEEQAEYRRRINAMASLKQPGANKARVNVSNV